MNSSELAQRFQTLFNQQPRVFRAPGRVNLIGEHTDYNDGFVMPAAIGFSTRVAVSPRSDGKLLLQSLNFPQPFEFDTGNLPGQRLGAWCDYILGVAAVLRDSAISISGANLLISSEVPIGAGLSSSAAVEVASALAFLSLSDARVPLPALAKLCQRAENEFVGARCGIMDQFISCLGKAGHALMLDCRSLEFTLVPIPENVRLVICNTMVKHEISGGEYNRRRADCEEGVRLLSQWYPGIRALRDVSPSQLEEHARDLPAVVYKRCTHVVEENERTTRGAQCLSRGDLHCFGRLMAESHQSLRDLYEVSCRELDIMVELAQGLPGFWGGRMTGGGFGGCTINLVEASQSQSFAQAIAQRYLQATGIKPDVYVCSAADGAGIDAEAPR
jgi:galactokinase